ncbi:Dual specificity protein kinase FUZ7 [Golovinomyces cichoracearum]|uniref:Dual specificity protein kinase FUZ7 n=1 Tax=Golovinomyces cichoracearum TaxID=62708 RepID=A0A420HA02_9PEZI|nr:Dual specificity protein kinase FUZ7 [Golovinomyces cichoracearum]
MSESIGQTRTLKRKNVKGLALSAAPRATATSENDNQSAGNNRNEDTRQNSQLEIGIEYKLDLKREDLEVLKDLGHGNGGTVSKVRHMATGTVMARKIIHVDANKEMRRRIVRELQIMHDTNSEYIVTFYGAFLSDTNDVIMCMEYMDVGALDRVSRKFGPVRVDVLGKIAEATLGGLTYLYTKHNIMHRDIKPSNILINSKGQIKLCDFGVSGELVNSVADTFVGTSTYMAPERIQGQKYTVKSDVWSFGLSIMELAIGKFPFDASEQLSDDDGAPSGILDLLQQIVYEPAPKLPKSEAFPQILEDMIQKCMSKEPHERPTPKELFESEPFVQAAKRTPVNLKEWAISLMEKDNRKSHLVPQLSPSTQQLLRSGDSLSGPHVTKSPDNHLSTPTSGITSNRGNDTHSSLNSHRHSQSSRARSPARFNDAHEHTRSIDASSTRMANTYSNTQAPSLASKERNSNLSPSARGVNFATHNLVMRPAPTGPLPPPVPKKEVLGTESKSMGKRLVTVGNDLYESSHQSNGNQARPYEI